MKFTFYNLTFIHSFASMHKVIRENTRMLWVFSTASKIASVCIIYFLLTTLMNEKNPCKRVIVDEDIALVN